MTQLIFTAFQFWKLGDRHVHTEIFRALSKPMSTIVMRNRAEVLIPHHEDLDFHSCRTESTLRESIVLQRNENSKSDGAIVRFPRPLMSAKLQKDELMRFIQDKCQDCSLDLDEPDHQKSYFFWSIMELFCKQNGRVMMAEIAVLLFKGYSHIRRKLGHAETREDWCLPLARLLCSAAADEEHREKIVQMGDEFASRKWTYAAQLCYVVAQIELGSRQQFMLIGCDSLENDSLLGEAMERTEVYEYVLSLTSGFGQPFFQEFKVYYCHEIAEYGHHAQALNYCESIAVELLRFPQCPQVCLVEGLVKLPAGLLERTQEDPEWPSKLRLLLNNCQDSAQLEFNPSDKDFNSGYAVAEMLGEGSFGSVYAGVQKSDGREPEETHSLPLDVALMEFVSRPPNSKKVVKLLEWFEASTFSIFKLEQPNPCMDLLPFSQRENSHLSEAMVQKIMLQVVEAARHCCDHGVPQRDIKPENILINPNTLEMKLFDCVGFGKISADLLQRTQEIPEWLSKLFLPPNNCQDSAQPEINHSDKDFDSCYTVGEMLGEGNFSSVYAGVRKSDGREVAIKFVAKDPQDEFITIPGETHSLPLEVALMKMVSRPPHCEKVVKLLEWFETSTSIILVLERPNPCMDLFYFCQSKNSHLTEAMVQKIMVQVVEAARHCCDRGVFHRDIKPENILINPDTLEIKLIDFGCGELLKDESYTTYAGTPAFWPPEWILHRKYHGVPATMWSLGILLFFLASGKYPFKSHKQIVKGELSFSPKLSVDCCGLIMWCLEQDPEYRPTFKEILDSDWMKHGPQEVSSPPADLKVVKTPQNDKKKRRNKKKAKNI